MNLSRSSITAAVLVLVFVVLGIGIALLVLVPSGFPQRVLALAAGCALAFGMVSAAGHLATQLRLPRRLAVTEVVPVEVERTTLTSDIDVWPDPTGQLGRPMPPPSRRS